MAVAWHSHTKFKYFVPCLESVVQQQQQQQSPQTSYQSTFHRGLKSFHSQTLSSLRISVLSLILLRFAWQSNHFLWPDARSLHFQAEAQNASAIIIATATAATAELHLFVAGIFSEQNLTR